MPRDAAALRSARHANSKAWRAELGHNVKQGLTSSQSSFIISNVVPGQYAVLTGDAHVSNF